MTFSALRAVFIGGVILAAGGLAIWMTPRAQSTTDSESVQKWLDEASRHLEAGRRDSSNILYTQAAELALHDSLWMAWADAVIGIAEIRRRFGNLEAAGYLLDSVQKVIVGRFGTENARYAMTLNRQGLILQEKNRPDSALPILREAYAIRCRVLQPNNPEIAWSLHNIGSQHNQMARHDSAVLYYGMALAMLRGVLGDDHLDVAWVSSNLSGAFRLAGDFDSARYYVNAALSIHLRSAASPDVIGSTYMKLGSLFSDLGEFRESVRYDLLALGLFNSYLSPTNREYIHLYRNLGNQYSYLGQYADADSAYARALAICLANRAFSSMARVYMKMGENLAAQHRHQEAIEIYRLAMEAMKQGEFKSYYSGRFRELIGISELALGLVDASIFHLRQSVDTMTAIYGRRSPWAGQACISLTLAYLQARRYPEACGSIQRALVALHRQFESDDIGVFPELEGTTHRVKMCYALKLKGDALKGLFGPSRDRRQNELIALSYDHAVRMAEAVRFSYRSREAIQFFGTKTHGIYQQAFHAWAELYFQSRTEGYLEKAFEAAERTRGFELRKALFQNTVGEWAWPDSLSDEARSLRRKLQAVENRIADDQRLSDADSALQFRLEEDRARMQSALDDLVRRGRRANSITGGEVPSLAGVRQSIPDSGEAVVEFVQTDSLWHVFIIRRDRVQLIRLGLLTSLGDDVDGLINAIRQQDFDSYAAQAWKLYQDVVQPWIAEAPSRLIIIPDGPLNKLPFEALLEKPAGKAQRGHYAALSYFVNTHTISLAPSCTILLHHSGRGRTDGALIMSGALRP